jgi:hypothetical protein
VLHLCSHRSAGSSASNKTGAAAAAAAGCARTRSRFCRWRRDRGTKYMQLEKRRFDCRTMETQSIILRAGWVGGSLSNFLFLINAPSQQQHHDSSHTTITTCVRLHVDQGPTVCWATHTRLSGRAKQKFLFLNVAWQKEENKKNSRTTFTFFFFAPGTCVRWPELAASVTVIVCDWSETNFTRASLSRVFSLSTHSHTGVGGWLSSFPRPSSWRPAQLSVSDFFSSSFSAH